MGRLDCIARRSPRWGRLRACWPKQPGIRQGIRTSWPVTDRAVCRQPGLDCTTAEPSLLQLPNPFASFSPSWTKSQRGSGYFVSQLLKYQSVSGNKKRLCRFFEHARQDQGSAAETQPEEGASPSGQGRIAGASTYRPATARCTRGAGAKSKRRQKILTASRPRSRF